MTSIQSVIEGLQTVIRQRRIVLLYWLVTLTFALVVVIPATAIAAGSLGHGIYAEHMLNGFDGQWLAELLFRTHGEPAIVFPPLIALIVAAFAVLTVFLTGGVLAVAADPATSFFAGCARNFPRLFRITLCAVGSYLVLAGVYFALHAATRNFAEEKPFVIANWILGSITMLLYFALNMVFDYARIIAASREDDTPVASAFRFVRRHPGRTAGAYALVLSLGILLTLLYLLLWRLGIPAVVLLVVQQSFLLARIGIRILFYTAQRILWVNTWD